MESKIPSDEQGGEDNEPESKQEQRDGKRQRSRPFEGRVGYIEGCTRDLAPDGRPVSLRSVGTAPCYRK